MNGTDGIRLQLSGIQRYQNRQSNGANLSNSNFTKKKSGHWRV